MNAQTANKYDYYRYPQRQAILINPLGAILGRIDAWYEMRLDPNFTRVFEVAFQPQVQDKSKDSTSPESAFTVGARERIYLVDNAAMLGAFAGVGVGAGLTGKNISVRLTTEVGYKFVFSSGTSHFFIEPLILLDSYIVTNYDSKRVLPYVALPFGYIW